MRPTFTLKKAKIFLWKSFFKLIGRGVIYRKKDLIAPCITLDTVVTL